MIRVTSMSEQQLDQASDLVAEAFLADGEGIFHALGLPRERVAKYMKAMMRFGIACGELYTVSENGEGYVCCMDSREEKSPFVASARMLWESIDALGLEGFIQYSRMFSQAGPSQEQKYRTRFLPYMTVSLLAVPVPYQHQGYMRKMLEEIFAMADERDLPVLLETDTESKMQRYCHLGMTCTAQHSMGYGVTYYDLIRKPRRRV